MHYVAVVNEQEYAVEVQANGGHGYTVCIDGRTLEVTAHPTGQGRAQDAGLDVHLGQAVHRVCLSAHGKTWNTALQGHNTAVQVVPLRQRQLHRARQQASDGAAGAHITCPMPGKVVTVLVQEGQKVVAGQGLVVVEAMKMENELRAPHAGTVQALSAQAGRAVEAGCLLCTIQR